MRRTKYNYKFGKRNTHSNSVEDLYKKLKYTGELKNVKKLVNIKPRFIIDHKKETVSQKKTRIAYNDGDIYYYDTENPMVILSKFYKRTPNPKTLIEGKSKSKNVELKHVIKDEHVNLFLYIKIRFSISDGQEERTFLLPYYEKNKNIYGKIADKIININDLDTDTLIKREYQSSGGLDNIFSSVEVAVENYVHGIGLTGAIEYSYIDSHNNVQEYLNNGNREISYRVEIVPYSAAQGQIVDIDFEKMELRENKPLILGKYNNLVYIESDGNCLKNFLIDKYHKISPKKIESIEQNIRGLIKFIEDYDLTSTIYTYDGSIYYSSTSKNRSYTSLRALVYGNHIYPLEDGCKKLSETKNDELKLKIKPTEGGLIKLREKLKLGEVPYDIYIDKKNFIRQFKTSTEHYIFNDDYEKIKKILVDFGLQKKVNPSMNILYCLKIIEEKYCDNTYSYMPNMNSFFYGGLMYSNYEIFPDIENLPSNVCIIDKNKSYFYELLKMENLIVCDFRTSPIVKYSKKRPVIDSNFYFCKKIVNSYLTKRNNLYPGYFINYLINNGIEIEIVEEIEGRVINNPYKHFLKKLLKYVEDGTITMKELNSAVSIFIGTMQTKTETCETVPLSINEIYKKDEVLRMDGIFSSSITDEFCLAHKTMNNIKTMKTRKLIAFQVLCNHYISMNEKIKTLVKDVNKDLLYVKTDAIAYFGKYPSKIVSREEKDLVENMGKWKQEKYKPIHEYEPKEEELNSIIPTTEDINRNKKMESIYSKKNKQIGIFNDCYAGVGKTHHIINNLVPKLISDSKTFIILSPSHASLSEYRKENINCDVIQFFPFNNLLEYDVIIIDEVGFCDSDAYELICKLRIIGKQYYCYGDLSQLLPVDGLECEINKQYIEYLFDIIIYKNASKNELRVNWRNNFSFSFYDKLISGEIDPVFVVNEYSTENYYDAETILCWYNNTCDYYNEKMLKKLELDRYDVGVKYMCKTNRYKEIYPTLYNSKEVKIHKKFDKYVILIDSDENTYEITYPQLNNKKYWKLGYARTIYNMQGDSTKSYFFPCYGNKFADSSRLNPRVAYTIVSRLEGDVRKKKN